VTSTDLHYFEHEQPREIELRQEFAEALAAVAPDVERPDVEQGHAYRLRKLAANFIAQQKLWSARANREGDWRTQLDDSEEIRQLCRNMNLEQLKAPFPPSDVSWRIGQAGKKQNGDIWAKVLAYIDNRNIQERLDSAVGPANWKNEYTKGPEGGVLCGLSIKVDGEWITKWDGAENSDIEPIKGGLSDSMKRAAVQWGIGRYLYELGENWAEIVDQKTQGAHYANCKVKVKGTEEWVQFHWLPPRGVLPTASTAQKLAAELPATTTADKVKPSETFTNAMKVLEQCVRDRDVNGVAKVMNGAEVRKSEGKLTANEHKNLSHECSLALRKIKELEHEPAAAYAG
jgi:hypothetical protein